MSNRKLRLDSLLVESGLFADQKTARSWILSGKVMVNDKSVAKAGILVPIDATLRVKGIENKYVSRGGLKLERALERFPISVRGKVILDAGASTGGFTDCLLKFGAARVFAVDVGFGQIRGQISSDPRVVSMEKTNISNIALIDLNPPIDLCTVDLSYLSLVKAVPILSQLFVKPVQMTCLFKPLYEGVPETRKNDLNEHHRALIRLEESLSPQGYAISNLIVSPILGNRGAIEYLLHIHRENAPSQFENILREALEEAKQLAVSFG